MQQITPESNLLRLDLSPSLTHENNKLDNCNNIPFQVGSIYQTPPHEDINKQIKHEQEQEQKLIDTSKKTTALIIHNIASLLSNWTTNLQVGKINNSIPTIRSFIVEIMKRSKCNKVTSILASFYFNKIFKDQLNLQKLPEFAKCSKRMFLICLIISHKFLTDNTYNMKTWSQISGLPVKTLVDMERWCLNKLNFELFIKKEILQDWAIKLSQNSNKLTQQEQQQTMTKKRSVPTVIINEQIQYQQSTSSPSSYQDVFSKRAKVLMN